MPPASAEPVMNMCWYAPLTSENVCAYFPVCTPEVLAAQELLAGRGAVHRCDRLRDGDAVRVELLRERRKVLAPHEAALRCLDRQDRVLAEQLVQPDPKLNGPDSSTVTPE